MPDFDDRGRLVGGALAEVWTDQRSRWAETERVIEDCRLLLAGLLPAPMPKAFADEWGDAFKVDFPQTRETPGKMLSVIEARRPELVRFATGTGERAMKVATRIEQACNAVLRADAEYGFPWAKVCDLNFNEVGSTVVVTPMPAHWEQAPLLRDPRTRQPYARYLRDDKGRGPDDDFYRFESTRDRFQADDRETTRAWREEKRAFLATRVPLVLRAFGIREARPIFGANETLEAVVIAREYTVAELRRKRKSILQLEGGKDQGARAGGAGRPLVMHEYLGLDDDGQPYISYFAEGNAQLGNDVQAVYDLSPWLSRLPAVWAWGQNWAGETNLDRRGRPFMASKLGPWRGVIALATGTVVKVWRDGFPTYAMIPEKDVPTALLDPDRERVLKLEPMTIMELPGRVEKMGGDPISPDVANMIQLMLGSIQEASPDSRTLGGGGGEGTAIGATVARRFVEDAHSQVFNALRHQYKVAGSLVFECLDRWAAKHGPVPIAEIIEGPISRDTHNSPTRNIVELEHGLAGEPPNYDLEAQFPRDLEDNLPGGMAWAELNDRGKAPLRVFLEKIGVASPEQWIAETKAEALADSPEGMADILALAAEIQGDEDKAQRIRLQAQGLIDEQTGLPKDLAQGLPPPPPPPLGGTGTPRGGGIPGMAVSNPAEQQLAAVIGAGMQAGPLQRIQQAGGVVPAGVG